MRCRIWQKSKSVIWITVSFANWSINKLPISDLIYKLFSRGRGLSKIFGTTNNFGVNTWRVLFPWHLPGSSLDVLTLSLHIMGPSTCGFKYHLDVLYLTSSTLSSAIQIDQSKRIIGDRCDPFSIEICAQRSKEFTFR